MEHIIGSKPLRTVLRWQLYATVITVLIAWVCTGRHGALSALYGGLTSWASGLVFAVAVSGNKVRTAGETLRTLFRAEAGKVLLVVILFWLVLTTYQDVVPMAFFAAFVVAVIVSQAAIVVRES